jgi:protein-disulfide isomerase
VERQLTDTYIKTGKVRFEFRHYIVIDSMTGGTESRRAAEASECANEQGKFWEYHNKLFSNQQGEGQGAFSDSRLKAFAAQITGLDTTKFNECFDAGRYKQAVQADHDLGVSMQVQGTPTVFVNGGQVQASFEAIQQAVDAALAKAQ